MDPERACLVGLGVNSLWVKSEVFFKPSARSCARGNVGSDGSSRIFYEILCPRSSPAPEDAWCIVTQAIFQLFLEVSTFMRCIWWTKDSTVLWELTCLYQHLQTQSQSFDASSSFTKVASPQRLKQFYQTKLSTLCPLNG